MRVERGGPDAGQTMNQIKEVDSNHVETDSDGLPIVDCDQPAPWSTPPQKTFKQVS